MYTNRSPFVNRKYFLEKLSYDFRRRSLRYRRVKSTLLYVFFFQSVRLNPFLIPTYCFFSFVSEMWHLYALCGDGVLYGIPGVRSRQRLQATSTRAGAGGTSFLRCLCNPHVAHRASASHIRNWFGTDRTGRIYEDMAGSAFLQRWVFSLNFDCIR